VRQGVSNIKRAEETGRISALLYPDLSPDLIGFSEQAQYMVVGEFTEKSSIAGG
jgi:hypothetical protein